jgi:uncharacterized protein YegL
MANSMEIVFILDKSGSMAGLEKDTIGGFNAMLAKQKAALEAGSAEGAPAVGAGKAGGAGKTSETGKAVKTDKADKAGKAVGAESADKIDAARLTTVLFNGGYELLHDRIDLNAVRPITEEEYRVGGSTALLDAVGKTINKIADVGKSTDKKHRAEKVIFVITTDGMENASREFSYSKIKEMVERQRNEYGWEFIFLGANIDAISTAGDMGIREEFARNYQADKRGTEAVYDSASRVMLCLRMRPCAKIDPEWAKSIDEDNASRGGARLAARPKILKRPERQKIKTENTD